MESKILVLATRNKGKTKEMMKILADYPITIKNLDDFGPIPEVVEDGATFEENAYKKASFTARVLGFPALADDSGLVVEALGGAPGVLSARYGGPGLDDAQRSQRLLDEMRGKTNRKAAFECVMSLAVPLGAALTYEGRCEGTIADSPVGEKGFGYDPVFYYEPFEKTFAQLTADEKNQVSHRGNALNEMASEFDKVMKWLEQQIRQSAPEKSGCMGGGC